MPMMTAMRLSSVITMLMLLNRIAQSSRTSFRHMPLLRLAATEHAHQIY